MAKEPSFQKIDYRVRPGKSAERKMLSEAFQRLSFFKHVENYRYIGFGSTTFTDFILFHRYLNIRNMISIEKREDYKERFNFNKPFDCIEIYYGDSNNILPTLSWDIPTIVWLDYDGRLTESVLTDVAYISANAISGNMLIVTVNAATYPKDPKVPDSEVLKNRLQEFKKEVGTDKVPSDIQGKNLEGKEMPKTCRRIIENEIEQVLRDKNGLYLPENQMRYQSLFNFIYRDGAKMMTIGGIFYKTSDERTLNQCQFDKLTFVNKAEAPYEIDIPVMTPRERYYLNQRLPQGLSREAEVIGLTETEINNYARLYRYCPAFAEVELS